MPANAESLLILLSGSVLTIPLSFSMHGYFVTSALTYSPLTTVDSQKSIVDPFAHVAASTISAPTGNSNSNNNNNNQRQRVSPPRRSVPGVPISFASGPGSAVSSDSDSDLDIPIIDLKRGKEGTNTVAGGVNRIKSGASIEHVASDATSHGADGVTSTDASDNAYGSGMIQSARIGRGGLGTVAGAGVAANVSSRGRMLAATSLDSDDEGDGFENVKLRSVKLPGGDSVGPDNAPSSSSSTTTSSLPALGMHSSSPSQRSGYSGATVEKEVAPTAASKATASPAGKSKVAARSGRRRGTFDFSSGSEEDDPPEVRGVARASTTGAGAGAGRVGGSPATSPSPSSSMPAAKLTAVSAISVTAPSDVSASVAAPTGTPTASSATITGAPLSSDSSTTVSTSTTSAWVGPRGGAAREQYSPTQRSSRYPSLSVATDFSAGDASSGTTAGTSGAHTATASGSGTAGWGSATSTRGAEGADKGEKGENGTGFGSSNVNVTFSSSVTGGPSSASPSLSRQEGTGGTTTGTGATSISALFSEGGSPTRRSLTASTGSPAWLAGGMGGSSTGSGGAVGALGSPMDKEAIGTIRKLQQVSRED